MYSTALLKLDVHFICMLVSAFGLQVQTKDVVILVIFFQLGSATHKCLAQYVSQNENVSMSNMYH